MSLDCCDCMAGFAGDKGKSSLTGVTEGAKDCLVRRRRDPGDVLPTRRMGSEPAVAGTEP